MRQNKNPIKVAYKKLCHKKTQKPHIGKATFPHVGQEQNCIGDVYPAIVKRGIGDLHCIILKRIERSGEVFFFDDIPIYIYIDKNSNTHMHSS